MSNFLPDISKGRSKYFWITKQLRFARVVKGFCLISVDLVNASRVSGYYFPVIYPLIIAYNVSRSLNICIPLPYVKNTILYSERKVLRAISNLN
jgi:hypothetical protein